MRHEDFDLEAIISYADGNMMSNAHKLIETEYEGMTYEDLTPEEKEELDLRLDNCASCGWTYDVQNMEEPAEDAGLMCWNCAEQYIEDNEE